MIRRAPKQNFLLLDSAILEEIKGLKRKGHWDSHTARCRPACVKGWSMTLTLCSEGGAVGTLAIQLVRILLRHGARREAWFALAEDKDQQPLDPPDLFEQ